MGIETAIMAAGLALSAVGTGASVYGMVQANEANKKAEKARVAQMNLDASRSRRQAIREMLVARGQAVSTATTQGASQGSGIAGGLAQINNQAGSNIVAINQNQEIGQRISRANMQATNGNTLASLGNGLQNIGGTILQNQEPLTRLAKYYGIG